MKIVELIDRRAVVADLRGQGKAELLRQLCAPVAALHPQLEAEQLLQTLLAREGLGSTGLAEGVAIPHGKVPGLDRLVGSFGRAIAGVEFEALDKQPTYLFVALFAPQTSSGDHLRALARVSRLLRRPPFRTRVTQAADAEAIYRLIAEEDARL